MKKILLFFAIIMTLAFASTSVFAEDDPLTPQNGLPLVIVRVDEEAGASIEEMNSSYDHSVRCESATMEIKLPENYKGGYPAADGGEAVTVPSEQMELHYIRGRGNSTWKRGKKKPYKLELNQAQDLFGMGSSEDWALLANCFDGSLIRNRITNWLGDEMGLEFTPKQIPVDLVLIGSTSGIHQYGSYCLCETVKVEKSRVNIDKLKKKDTENITGGYLMAIYSDQGEEEPESTRFTTNYGVEFINDTPEYVAKEGESLTDAQLAQREYIQAYMQELENLIMAPGEIDASRHAQIAERMDLTSTADYWLLQEIPFNTDGFATTSTYLYKKRDGKLYWGPLWDFDYAWNNNGMWNQSNETFNNTAMLWIDQLRDKDPQFKELLQERWTILNGKLQELTAQAGIIDQFRDEVSVSAQADYNIWSNAAGSGEYNGKADYAEEIENLKLWINNRRTWADAHTDQLGEVYLTVTYEANGQAVATERVRYGTKAVMDPDAIAPDGYVFDCWKKGDRTLNKVTITEDTTFTAQYVEEDKAVAPEELMIDIPEEMTTVDVSKGFFPVIDRDGYSLNDLAIVEPYGTVTNPRITWTSSNEKVGTIDPVNKRVILKAGGDITITGTLYNGISASFVLHVTGPAPDPDPQPEPTPEPQPETINIQGEEVVLSATAYTYDGKTHKPMIKSIGKKTLVEGTDYTAYWSDASSKNAGTYTVTIKGKGKYTGETKANYKINKAANTLKIKGKKVTVQSGKLKKKAKTLSVTKVITFTNKGQGAKTYQLVSARKGKKSFKKKFKINEKSGKVTVKKGVKNGTYKVKVKVKAAGNANYNALNGKTVTITIIIK